MISGWSRCLLIQRKYDGNEDGKHHLHHRITFWKTNLVLDVECLWLLIKVVGLCLAGSLIRKKVKRIYQVSFTTICTSLAISHLDMPIKLRVIGILNLNSVHHGQRRRKLSCQDKKRIVRRMN